MAGARGPREPQDRRGESTDAAGRASSRGAPQRLWLILALVGGGAVILFGLLCCGGVGAWWLWSGGPGGVTFAEKAVIMQQLDMNREAGNENEPVYVLWDGMPTTDANGKNVKLVRVRFYQRNNLNQVFDKVSLLRDGQEEAWVNNPFGDGWKTKIAQIPDLLPPATK
jgi:hypothetical protein